MNPLDLIAWMYHETMYRYYGWRKRVAIRRFRKYARSQNWPEADYSDEAIIEGCRRYVANKT